MIRIVAFVLAGVLALAAYLSLFIVDERQQALVLQFGRFIRTVTEPGLHVKVPFLQNVVYIDERVLDFDAPAEEVILGDRKRLVVDAFARYRITDARRFYQSVRTEVGLRSRIDTILDDSLRKVLGDTTLFTVLSADRAKLMEEIRDDTNAGVKSLGIDVVDVRIKRADLPAENSEAIYLRMQTEREREAKELRAQGYELGQRIRASADRERRVLIAEAQKKAQIIRGQGDGKATGIFAQAFGQDVEFFTFYRSMQAYERALGDDNTSFVLSPDSEFFQFFDSSAANLPRSAESPSRLPTATGDAELRGSDRSEAVDQTLGQLLKRTPASVE